jgi:hypothetical protein
MMRMTRAVLAGAVVLLVAGCSATSDGTASPASQDPGVSQSVSSSSSESQSPSGGQLPHSGAPAVSDPLPESAIPEDPCDVFTREQIEYALGDDAPEGERDDFVTGPVCKWRDSVSGATVWASYSTKTREGLSSFYQNAQPRAQVWRELSPIGGFPAIAYQAHKGGTSCSVVIGVADDFAVTAAGAPSRARYGKTDPCEMAQDMAEMLVGNLKERAGR